MIHVIGPKYKTSDDALVINTTSRSQDWSRNLSPFFTGPVVLYDGYRSINIENAWQFSKVYEYHLESDGSVGERYFDWAKTGWNDIKAHRYPMGKGAKPLYSYWDGKKLGYLEARKEIYIPLYSKAVQKTYAFKKLKEIYTVMDKDKTLYLWDFDAHSLMPGTFDYWDLWNNPSVKVGHAYVLAMLLEGVL
jgi:hypothetical protein